MIGEGLRTLPSHPDQINSGQTAERNRNELLTMIRVTQTIVATTDTGETFSLAKPVEVQWYKGESLMAAASAVNQIMADSEDKKWSKTVSINIDLEWSDDNV